MKVLCIGAHCDDVEVGCGGTIFQHVKREDTVYILVMSATEERAREAEEVGTKLHVKSVRICDFEDTRIPSGFEAIKKIEAVIKRVTPDRVYTHTPRDTHQDHRNTGLASLSAARNVPQILFYLPTPPKSWAFSPNYYVDISEYMERKIETIKLFESQRDKWYMKPEVLRSMARFRGLEIGVEYAEAFGVYKMLGDPC